MVNHNDKKSKDIHCKPCTFYDWCIKERDGRVAVDNDEAATSSRPHGVKEEHQVMKRGDRTYREWFITKRMHRVTT